MSCGCKNDSINKQITISKGVKINSGGIIFRLSMFVISIPILLLMLPYVVYILFNSIVLQKNSFNVVKSIAKFGNKLKSWKQNNNENISVDNSDDVELMDVNVVKKPIK